MPTRSKPWKTSIDSKGKRSDQQANKRKAKQRQQHYIKTLLRHRRSYLDQEE